MATRCNATDAFPATKARLAAWPAALKEAYTAGDYMWRTVAFASLVTSRCHHKALPFFLSQVLSTAVEREKVRKDTELTGPNTRCNCIHMSTLNTVQTPQKKEYTVEIITSKHNKQI